MPCSAILMPQHGCSVDTIAATMCTPMMPAIRRWRTPLICACSANEIATINIFRVGSYAVDWWRLGRCSWPGINLGLPIWQPSTGRLCPPLALSCQLKSQNRKWRMTLSDMRWNSAFRLELHLSWYKIANSLAERGSRQNTVFHLRRILRLR